MGFSISIRRYTFWCELLDSQISLDKSKRNLTCTNLSRSILSLESQLAPIKFTVTEIPMIRSSLVWVLPTKSAAPNVLACTSVSFLKFTSKISFEKIGFNRNPSTWIFRECVSYRVVCDYEKINCF